MFNFKSAEPVTLGTWMDVLRKSQDDHTQVVEEGSGEPMITKRSMGATVKFAVQQNTDQLKALAEARGFDWYDGAEKNVVPYWASDERVDWHGDIVQQSWNFDVYHTNSVLLDSHQWGAPPIGGVINESVVDRKDAGYTGKALQMLALFPQDGIYDWADTLKRLVASGFLKTCSVGFFPGNVLNVKDAKERKAAGLGDVGFIFQNNKLVELSPTSVPANPGASAVMNRLSMKSMLKPTDVMALRELRRRELVGKPEMWKRYDATIIGTWKLLYPDQEVAEHKDVSQPLDPNEVKPSNGLETVSAKHRELEGRVAACEDCHKNLAERVNDMAGKAVTAGLTIESIVKASGHLSMDELVNGTDDLDGRVSSIEEGQNDINSLLDSIEDEDDPEDDEEGGGEDAYEASVSAAASILKNV